MRDRARISQLLPIRQRVVVENETVLKLTNNNYDIYLFLILQFNASVLHSRQTSFLT